MKSKKGFVILFALFLLTGTRAHAAPLPGQIIVDPRNPAWLVYNRDQNGDGMLDPFFLAGPGDPEGFLYLGTRSANGARSGGPQDSLIEQIKNSGANGLYIQGIRSHGGDGKPDHNPFENSNPSSSLDEDILNQWEAWFSAMDNAGIAIFFFFFDDDARVWNTGDAVSTEEKRYLEGIVHRFKHHKHLIWLFAEEYSKRYSKKHVENAAAIIADADDHDHPIGTHQLTGDNTFDFTGSPNMPVFAHQPRTSGTDSMHASVVEAVRDANRRFHVTMAEGSHHVGLMRSGDRLNLRRSNWGVALGGAYTMVFGMWGQLNGNDAAVGGTGGGASPTPEMLRDLGLIHTFFEMTNFNTMGPHDELKHGGTKWVLADPGKSYIAYSFDRPSNLGIKGMRPGTYDLLWFDTVTGSKIESKATQVTGGDTVWSVPSALTSGEIALHIRESSSTGTVTTGTSSGGAVSGLNSAPCHKLLPNSEVSNGFGVPWSVFSSARELLIQGMCSESGITVSVGSGGQSQYIYNLSHTYSGGRWSPITLSGGALTSNVWLTGSGTATITKSIAEQSTDTFYVAYVCNFVLNAWKCGCRDQTCAQNMWQLQIFRR